MTSLNNINKFMKDFATKAVVIMTIVLIAFSLPALNRNQNEEQEISLETFDVNYFNNSDNAVDVRYKYIMGYEYGEIELPDDWDYKKPLFSLYHNGKLVHEARLMGDRSILIPEVSNSFKLKSKQSTDDNFEILVNKKAESFQNLVRFEVTIVIEELKENKWSPVYQVIFMERGPYWSLNKGPIELLPIDWWYMTLKM